MSDGLVFLLLTLEAGRRQIAGAQGHVAAYGFMWAWVAQCWLVHGEKMVRRRRTATAHAMAGSHGLHGCTSPVQRDAQMGGNNPKSAAAIVQGR